MRDKKTFKDLILGKLKNASPDVVEINELKIMLDVEPTEDAVFKAAMHELRQKDEVRSYIALP